MVKKSLKRVGILGGTFNPVHLGHLVMAQSALESLQLEQVIFVPSFLPPHKTPHNVIPAKDRYQMVKLAIQGNDQFAVSDFEVKQRGRSYSIHTARHFRQLFPKSTKFYFIIGQDSLQGLSHWKQIDTLRRLVTFVVLNRSGAKQSRSPYPVRNIKMPAIDISSSQVRKQIAEGKSVKYLVPEKVFQYIIKQKLYQR